MGGGKLTAPSVTQTFTGDVEGDGAVQWLMSYRKDGTADFVGLQRVRGSIGGRTGTFVMETIGEFDGKVAAGRGRSSQVQGPPTWNGFAARAASKRRSARSRRSSSTTSSAEAHAVAGVRRLVPPELLDFLEPFPDDVSEIVLALRGRVLVSMPKAHETVWTDLRCRWSTHPRRGGGGRRSHRHLCAARQPGFQRRRLARRRRGC